MASILDGSPIDLPCPGCGHKNRKTVGWIKLHSRMTCAGCGRDVILDSSDFRRGMRNVDTQLDKLSKTFRKLGRR